MPASTSRRCIRPGRRRRRMAGPRTPILKAAEACHKAGVPFGIGLGTTSDIGRHRGRVLPRRSAPNWSTPRATSRSSPTRCGRRSNTASSSRKFYPPDAPAWDDASNNKWLVSGRGALIMNPPSAWAVAKRDAPQVAEQCWTHGMPSGPKGRFAPFLPYFWGDLELRQEQAGGEEPAGAPVAAGGGREDGGGERRLRSAVVREADRRSRPGPRKGRRRARSTTTRTRTTTRSCRWRRRRPRPRSRMQIYTQAILTKMIVRHPAGRGDGEDARLGRERGRRLHADLSVALKAFASQAGAPQWRVRAITTSRGDRAGRARAPNLPVRQ